MSRTYKCDQVEWVAPVGAHGSVKAGDSVDREIKNAGACDTYHPRKAVLFEVLDNIRSFDTPAARGKGHRGHTGGERGLHFGRGRELKRSRMGGLLSGLVRLATRMKAWGSTKVALPKAPAEP